MNIATFNYIEASVWFLLGALLLLKAWRGDHGQAYFKVQLLAAITFWVFAGTDVIEAHTGAWWRPPALLVVKVLCVMMLLGCYWRYQSLRKP